MLIGGALGRHRPLRAAMWVMALAQGVAVVLQAGTVAWAVAASVQRGAMAPAGLWVLAVAAVLARAGLQAGREALARRLARRVAGDQRARLRAAADAAGPMGPAARDPGGWSSRYLNDVDALSGWFATWLPARDAVWLLPPLLLAAAFWLDWLAAALLLFAAPLIPAFMVLVGLGSRRLQARQQHEQQRLEAHFLDRVRALDLVRRSGAVQAMTAEVFAAADRYRRLGMRVLRLAFVSSAVLEFFAAVAIGVIAIYVGFGLLGSIDYGPAPGLDLYRGLFVLLLAPEFFLPLRQLGVAWHERAAGRAAADRLAGLVEVPGADAAVVASRLPLELHGVQVAPAPGAAAVVGPVDLALAPGEVVLLGGASGSGKSSLLATCAGFLPPAAGRVARAGGFAWLGQRGHLFHGSIAENLRLAAPDADAATLAAALAAAGLPVDHPSLPDGLDTAIGEGRRGLSGGQAQRVGLARVWLSRAPLWLLDEPTRGLDPESARAFWGRLAALAAERGAAVLAASHDPAAAAFAQRRLRIRDGRLEALDDATA